ncbi:MAG TPA: diadenylate cyclase CdaA [Bacteroidales bacterium]|nr:diadenylate cyclase CdaA [Bacteroidales bacterium]HPT01681.1 diadenylate cyclase CdaA [Bacteroidales bacterium]
MLSFLSVRVLDIVDILLVALLLYWLYQLLKGTAAVNIFLGILAIFALWRVVKALGMDLLSDLLGAFISVGFIAFIVVFQPEIRKFLLAIGSPGFFKKTSSRFLFWKIKLEDENLSDIDPVVQACQRMAMTKTGALIIVSRKNDLTEFTETGVAIDATITDPLIESIFYKNNPLHDGAMVISLNRIKAVRCILPVSSSSDLPNDLGLRHRAALGVSERTDAISIIVSEQTGNISYCRDGQLSVDIKAAGLRNMLLNDFSPAVK